MALYNEILVGRFNRYLQKMLGMKGGPPAPQLSSEIQPVLPYHLGVEDRVHQGWDKFAFANFTGPGGVGTFVSFVVRNPVGSNVGAVIEKLKVGSGVTANFTLQHGPLTTDAAVILSQLVARQDPRSVRPASSLILSAQALGVQITISADQDYGKILTAGMMDFVNGRDQQILLLPGDAISLFDTTGNITVYYSVWWRERFLEDSERT